MKLLIALQILFLSGQIYGCDYNRPVKAYKGEVEVLDALMK